MKALFAISESLPLVKTVAAAGVDDDADGYHFDSVLGASIEWSILVAATCVVDDRCCSSHRQYSPKRRHNLHFPQQGY